MLTVDQFADFFGEVHSGGDPSQARRQPFPWQLALLRRVVERGWPDGVDVPTGLGKTSILDVAVFAAALGVDGARRRIFYVVDRRLIVDEAYEHARRIAAALDRPTGDTTRLVAQQLRASDDDVTLDVTRMRGGVTWERTWLERPDRYAIVTGTVDQIGSRLLFRGYGVSERARSIDAALVGTDSLIVIDEAHLAQAFVNTAQAAFDLDATSVARRPVVVTMSATSPPRRTTEQTAVGDRIHRISEDDEQHEIAGERLTAAKRLHLVEVKTTKKSEDSVVSAAMAALAERLAEGRVVGVVTNTVARARAVFELLRDQHDAVLLTGRSRPIDRDCLLAAYYPRLRVDRDRDQQQPLIVVATQTIEVGANIDLDALITESAPLASLVQRLGRLNRVARSRHPHGVAVVVHPTATGEDDPVYGPARLATWQWLADIVEPVRYAQQLDPTRAAHWLDAAPTALRRLTATLTDDEHAAMRGITPYIPVLQRHHLDTWARTAPAPEPDQPIEPFLHGITDNQPPISVVWRHGLGNPDTWAELIDEVPPVAEETLELPATAVRRWLLESGTDHSASDLDNPTTIPTGPTDTNSRQPARIPLVLRYRGRGDATLAAPWQICPGDTIVLPTDVGGCDPYGWHPASTDPVLDVADLALRRGRPVLRLGPTLVQATRRWGEQFAGLAQRLVDQAAADAHTARPVAEPYLPTLKTMRDTAPGGPLRDVLTALLGAHPRVTRRTPVSTGFRPYLGLIAAQIGRLGDDDTAAGSSSAGQRIRLTPHQAAVAARARQFAERLNLPTTVIQSIAAAARWHDEGKRDPRFQTMLWGGDRAAAEIADEPLAKSGLDPSDRAAFARARKASGYTNGMRHEALSAVIVAARSTNDPRVHPELVIHLVASHHGHARPLLPPIIDPAPTKVTIDDVGTFDTADTIDWQQPSRFIDLNATYGRWGLALLETIVRLADIWCSARNEAIEDTP
ncbi:type I-U CRISPR-associated helicase/endonuclease Cas3 [Micromonospora zingiberis]|uniref:Type I-U CRISPR-associated helicase/endonuclease Cas3 n=1 Tax=Micromonospora zingiberis TaxID=2053011 RepID=A0A4V2LUV9_9ACTN|nr:type I-U CRISPR-associated helicase/endonuclease Cas3 [Micromonospora zingiberis]TCB89405.1 type I-U CRISPR-associated helicase/endonuclease Cas3 [Micromonospora zingiberis]